MQKYLLAAVAALAIGGTAHAGVADEEACMRYGTTSNACQYARQMQELENRERQEQQQERARAQWCSFHRC